MKKLIIALLISFSISGCLPSIKIVESEYKIFNLTNEIAESRDRDFFVLVPQNWFHTKDTRYDGNEIWIIHENYIGVIVIKKINLIGVKKSSDDLENLLELAKSYTVLYKRKYGEKFKITAEPLLMRNGNVIYSAFEYKFGDNQFARVLITEKNGNYFECIAYSAGKGYGEISLIELFSIQESVINTLAIR